MKSTFGAAQIAAGRAVHSTILVALALLAVLLVACSDGEGDPAPASTAVLVPGPSETPQTPPIAIVLPGEVARTDTAAITVHGARRSNLEGGQAPPEGFRWVLLDVSLEHLGTEPLPFDVTFVHADGRVFQRAHPPSASPELSAPIEPGASLRGEIAFLVEADTRSGALVFGLGTATWAIQLSMIEGD